MSVYQSKVGLAKKLGELVFENWLGYEIVAACLAGGLLVSIVSVGAQAANVGLGRLSRDLLTFTSLALLLLRLVSLDEVADEFCRAGPVQLRHAEIHENQAVHLSKRGVNLRTLLHTLHGLFAVGAGVTGLSYLHE